MEKFTVFEEELNLIKNEAYRNDARILLNNLPEYFYEVGASSTGKYHPKFAQGELGLVRHTKVLIRILADLVDNPSIGNSYTNSEKDLLIVAALIHDGLKHGKEKSKYVVFEHPLLATNYLKEMKSQLKFSDEEITFMVNVINSHMGTWNKDYNGNEVLPVPKTKYEKLLHMCDYLASRKYLDVVFDEKNNIVK